MYRLWKLLSYRLNQAIMSDKLSRTICTTVRLLVIGVSQTSLMVGGFRSKALLLHCERVKLIPQRSAAVKYGQETSSGLSSLKQPRKLEVQDLYG